MEERWQPTSIDLILSVLVAVIFPFIAGVIYMSIGALIPMLMYYGLAWGIVKWRRGETGYHLPRNSRVPKSFLVNLGLIIVALIFGYQARIIDTGSALVGVLFTIFIWAPINASSEQLLWIYIFESYDLYPNNTDSRANKLIIRSIGLVLFSAFVGLIHFEYWAIFLQTVDSRMLCGVVFVVLTSLSGYLHIIVWRESKNMFFTFIPHLLLNIAPTLWTGYSLLPYLISF